MKMIELKVVTPTGVELRHINAELIENVEPGVYLGDEATLVHMTSGDVYPTVYSVEKVLQLMVRGTCAHEKD